VRNKSLDRDGLIDEATGDMFVLFWKAIALPAVKALPCF